MKILSYLKSIHSSNSANSSKRLYGAIGFLVAIAYIGIWQRDLTDLLLITSASLLGLESITKIFNQKSK